MAVLGWLFQNQIPIAIAGWILFRSCGYSACPIKRDVYMSQSNVCDGASLYLVL